MLLCICRGRRCVVHLREPPTIVVDQAPSLIVDGKCRRIETAEQELSVGPWWHYHEMMPSLMIEAR